MTTQFRVTDTDFEEEEDPRRDSGADADSEQTSTPSDPTEGTGTVEEKPESPSFFSALKTNFATFHRNVATGDKLGEPSNRETKLAGGYRADVAGGVLTNDPQRFVDPSGKAREFYNAVDTYGEDNIAIAFEELDAQNQTHPCLLYTSPSPRDS